MKNKLKVILNFEFVKFGLVGVINTLVGTLIMFSFYNLLNLSYLVSTASNYFFGSMLSYYLNKNFTFKYKYNNRTVIAKFIIVIITCYALAYGVSKPIIDGLLNDLNESVRDNISMVMGAIIFVVLNYFGQKKFVFPKQKN